MFAAKILADSISPDGVRLTTMEVTFPRIVLAEFNTHRMFSRNSASSRAIPIEKRIAAVEADPFMPAVFGKNQKGMQASEDLADKDALQARAIWNGAKRQAIIMARGLAEIGVHKQLANRLLEPFLWHTVICSATEWSNFFALRCNKDAQPEIRTVAEMMRDLYESGNPVSLDYGQWHLPLVSDDEVLDLGHGLGTLAERVEAWKKISVGRCARVSVLTHDGKRDLLADIELCDRLQKAGHMSPFEHVARPMTREEHWQYHTDGARQSFCGNFDGWIQYRKELPHEDNFGRIGT